MTPLLEVCVDCLASLEACAASGVHRIELCAGLVEGGTTPSVGFLKAARAAFSGRIMMMIRPRAGDFVVSSGELQIMRDDIQAARDHGADGVVFGCLLPDGEIDRATAELLTTAADGMDLTFHRAFDVSRDLSRSLETLIALGIPRVLTSGGMPSVEAGFDNLIALHRQAAGRIALLTGGGLKLEHIPRLRAHGLQEFHLSGRSSFESLMQHRRPDIPMGASEVPGEYVRRVADAVILRDVLRVLA
jgi:copper homeostasis protein